MKNLFSRYTIAMRRILGDRPTEKEHSLSNTLRFSTRHDTDTRWDLIQPKLGCIKNAWALDIGCNDGDILRRFTSEGGIALGIESFAENKPATLPINAGIMISSVDPAFMRSIPNFNYIFLLSVFHRIWACQTPSYAEDVLRYAILKSDTLIFEGCSSHSRYVDNLQIAPSFEDLNEDSSLEWHYNLLKRNTPQQKEVELIGTVYTTYTKEARQLFTVRNNNQEIR